jgi:hypothetical protein
MILLALLSSHWSHSACLQASAAATTNLGSTDPAAVHVDARVLNLNPQVHQQYHHMCPFCSSKHHTMPDHGRQAESDECDDNSVRRCRARNQVVQRRRPEDISPHHLVYGMTPLSMLSSHWSHSACLQASAAAITNLGSINPVAIHVHARVLLGNQQVHQHYNHMA